ncbi:hypothetical protein JMJ77_0013812, partial [Colletotrichum scovillei]
VVCISHALSLPLDSPSHPYPEEKERLRIQIGCRDMFIVVAVIPQLEHVAIQIASIKREFR